MHGREFKTGATRDRAEGKLDYEAFLSPSVLERYAQYMDKHRLSSDGTLRDGDNWQRGIPIQVYQKSLVRHLFQAWGVWRGQKVLDDRGDAIDIEEALCAIIFNSMGMLHEVLIDRKACK